MKENRRVGSERSATRVLILDATQKLMIERGYAAVSARRVAEHAGVRPALVQYYFPNMESLFLALYRREAEYSIERQVASLASHRPLDALWAANSDTAQAALGIEFMALANHRKAIRAEIVAYNERARILQAEALETVLRLAGIDTVRFPPAGVSLLLASAARGLVMEDALGITAGHDDARGIIERWLAAASSSSGG